MSLSYIEQIKQLPTMPGETWQGDFVRVPAWVGEAGRKPYRPVGFLWASVQTGMVGASPDFLVAPEEKDFAMALAALVAFGGNEMGGTRPERLEVRDAELADYLSDALAEVDIEVVHRRGLPVWEARVRALDRAFEEDDSLPGYLKGKDVTVKRVRAFAEAAAEFYEAEPWRHLVSADLIKIESPRCGAALKYAIVLGAGGQEFGLGFYRSVDDFWDSHSAPEKYQQNVLDQGIWSILFCPITEIPMSDVDLWEDHGLAVAGETAYPLAMMFYTSRTRRPSAEVLSFFEGLLRALATTTEEDLTSGRWTRDVMTYDGDVEYKLSLPMFLDPPSPRLLYQHGFHDRRATEAQSAQISRFLAGKDFSSIDEANAAVREEFAGMPLDRPKYAPRTPLEEAQDLCYKAFDSIGYRRVVLARRAIEISGNCADAYVLLAEAAASPQEQAEVYAAGVEAGKRALGDEFLRGEAEYLWGHLEARPFLRALQGLAYSNVLLDRIDEAIAQYRELLRLNPEDNQGNRYTLLPLLIVTGQDDEAEALLAEYDDPDAVWLYGRALLAFRRDGDNAESRKVLRKAIKANPHVPGLLLEEDESETWPNGDQSDEVDDALFCAEVLQQAWEITPGALEWLESRR